jgi:hypothetical protein
VGFLALPLGLTVWGSLGTVHQWASWASRMGLKGRSRCRTRSYRACISEIICREIAMAPMSGKRPDRMPIRPEVKARVQAVVERMLGAVPAAPVRRRRELRHAARERAKRKDEE